MRRGGIVPIDPDPTSSPLIPTVMCPKLLIRFQTSNTVSSTALYPQRPRYNRREGVLIVPRAAVAASLGTKPRRAGSSSSSSSSSNISGPSSIRGRRPSARKNRRRAPPRPRHGDQDRSSHQVDSSRTVDAARSEALADEQQRSDISSINALRQLDRE
jgi:hypothetical protein